MEIFPNPLLSFQSVIGSNEIKTYILGTRSKAYAIYLKVTVEWKVCVIEHELLSHTVYKNSAPDIAPKSMTDSG